MLRVPGGTAKWNAQGALLVTHGCNGVTSISAIRPETGWLKRSQTPIFWFVVKLLVADPLATQARASPWGPCNAGRQDRLDRPPLQGQIVRCLPHTRVTCHCRPGCARAQGKEHGEGEHDGSHLRQTHAD